MKLLDYTIVTPTETTTVSLFPFYCVHLDNPGHSDGHWREFLEEVKATPYGYALGGGDYHDWLRTHARDFLRMYPHDRNSFDALHKYRHEATEKFAIQLEPIKDRLIGLHVGNHHHEYPNGENDTMEMARLLKVNYLEQTCLTRLTFKCPDRPAHKVLTMLTLHGEGVGGGSTAGGDINAMVNKGTAWDTDIVIMGHNHQKNAAQTVHLGIPPRGTLRLQERDRVFIRGGCFVRGYVAGCTTYAEKNLLKPTAIGNVRLDIRFTSPRRNGKDRQYAERHIKHVFKCTV